MSRLPLPTRSRTTPIASRFAGLVRPPDPLAPPDPSRRVDLVWTDEVTGERLEIEVVADPELIERLRGEGFEELLSKAAGESPAAGSSSRAAAGPSAGDRTAPDDETAAA